MGEDPNMIRREIEETRERMGDTVDALSYKADVKTRTQEAVSDKVASVKEKIGGAVPSREDLPSVGTPDVDVRGKARRAGGLAQENPLGLAIGSVALGFLGGLLIPSTRMENERIGPVADQVKEKVADTASEAMQHGKEVAQEVAQQTVQTAQETAREAGQEHAEQVKESAQQNAQDVQQSVRS